MRNNEDRFGATQEIQDSSPIPQIMQKEVNQASGLNFIVPTEFIDLPSKGKFYPVGHPLRGKDVIEVKQMTAKEEDILTSKSLLKKGIALDKLLESLIVDKTIKQNTLTLEDRNAIIVAARIAAYGPDYTTTVTCPSCTQKTKFTFNLFEVDSREREQTSAEVDESGNFPIDLPATKWRVICRPLNGNDEKIIMNLMENKKKMANDSMLIDQLKLTIVSIQGVTDRGMIENALSSMPARDSRILRTKYQEIVNSFELVRPFVCSSCSYEADLEVPLTADFFWFK